MKKLFVALIVMSLLVCTAGCDFEMIESTSEASYEASPETSDEPSLEISEEPSEEPSAPISEEASVDETPEPSVEEPGEEEKEVYVSGDLVFDTEDIYGNPVTDEIIFGSKLVLLNLWEPWCGPCVGEMPDLQDLYEKYKDRGLLVLGGYSSFDMDDVAMEVVDSIGITYPILRVDDNLYAYEQNYVPSTFIFDGEGNLVESDPIPGAMSYEKWEKLILQYLD